MRLPGTGPLCAWLLSAGLAVSAAARSPVAFSEDGDFSEAAVLRGVAITQAQCITVGNAVWADAGQHGQACIRYWAAGFSGTATKRAVVFLHGDIFVGVGKTNPTYLALTSGQLQQRAQQWATSLGVPYVFIGRPGTHGSSGDHMQRRRPAESALLSAALDQIRQRLHIQELVLAGQSGGGHATASLLTRRHDIVCAVPTSAPSSPRVRWASRGLTKDTTGYSDSYEPAEHLGRGPHHPELRVFVLGDPNDRNVPWAAQTVLADRLRPLGIPVRVLQGQGAGPDLHGLPRSAHAVAAWCHQGLSTEAIERKAAAGLKG